MSRSLLALALIALLIGCSPRRTETPRYKVTGVVTFKGAPLASGKIYFESPEDRDRGEPPNSTTIVDGAFELMSTAGEKSVRISAREEFGNADETGARRTRETIPEKYSQESELTVTVEPSGERHFEFELE